MLKKVDLKSGSIAQTTFGEAEYPAPFAHTLEYSAASRGPWNIAHTGMLIPEAHEIFVCAQGCLRGVVLTAAEMGKQDRFSSIFVQEDSVLNGNMEDLIIDGVTDILSKLHYTPRAVLLYTSCIHHFINCDLTYVYSTLRKKFPAIDFIDCYMTPTMRKSGLTPDELIAKQMYALWHKRELKQKHINLIANNIQTDKECELYDLAQNGGFLLREIHDCQSYDEYQEMAAASLNIVFRRAALPGAEYLKQTYGQKYLYLPTSYNYTEMLDTLHVFADYLGVELPDYSHYQALISEKLGELKTLIADTPIMVDYTFSAQYLSLARLLLENGFNVVRVYTDSFNEDNEQDFYFIKENFHTVEINATVNFKMRFVPRENAEKVLAIGQKAAYFNNTPYFVNTVENSGFYGFSGILKMLDLIREAYREPKDTEKLVQMKAWGCELI